MSQQKQKLRPLEFRLSLEASERINERIQTGSLDIFQDCSEEMVKQMGQLARREYIAGKAISILETNGHSTRGCSDERSIREWLSRKRGKELLTFAALCEVVNEDWHEVLDRSLLEEILTAERKRLFISLMNQFTSAFISQEKQIKNIRRNRKKIEPLFESGALEFSLAKDVIKIFLEEYAINGRKVRFQLESASGLCRIKSVVIKGHNQDDILATWQASYSEPYPKIVEAAGWWWKGCVNIQFRAFDEKDQTLEGSCEIHVPAEGYIWFNVLFSFDNRECTEMSSEKAVAN